MKVKRSGLIVSHDTDQFHRSLTSAQHVFGNVDTHTLQAFVVRHLLVLFQFDVLRRENVILL